MNRSPVRAFVLIPLVLACFALSPQARATCQDACLSNNNTVQGDDALISLTTGTDNTAIGFQALLSNTTGSGNTATGSKALLGNTTGLDNTAIGVVALVKNTTGVDNTAIGAGALPLNTTGSANTAIGLQALQANTQGNSNTAIGFDTLFNNQTGNSNTAIGYAALLNAGGSNNIALGAYAGQNLARGSRNIDIGNGGMAGESNKIRIGTGGIQTKTFIAGISGVTVPAGVGVIIGPNGQLGTVVSSERFKDAVKPMDNTSEAILALKPVTFRYKHELDPEGIPQFGLVAEEVEKVNPALVARDEQGKAYTVRYEAVNAMLLNEFLKEYRTVQEQKATIAQLKAAVATQEATTAHQQKQIEALTAGLQRVSAQLGADRSSPQMTLNSR
jgi:trimeric autotransporter adhesin